MSSMTPSSIVCSGGGDEDILGGRPTLNERNTDRSCSAASRGCGEATIAETTAMPSRAWFVRETEPCKVRRRFVDFMPPCHTR